MEVSEINAIAKSVNELGQKIDNEVATKAELKKHAEAVAALSKAMDERRLVEKTHPLFGDMKTARDFIDTMKGALAGSEVPAFRNVVADKSSGFYAEKADLNSYGTGTGVELVPTAVSDVFSYLLSQGGVARQNATVISGLQGNVTLTKRNGTSTAAFTVATTNKDDVAVTPGSFGTASVTLSPQQISALSLVSDKLLYTSAVNVAEMVAIDLVEQASVLEDNCVIRGAGTAAYGLTTGLNTASSVGEKTVEISDFVNLDGLLAMPGLVHESVYGSPNAAYFISGKVLSVIRGFKSTNAGYYLDPTTGQFNLGGYPVKVWHRLDNDPTTAGQFVAYFGDMRKSTTIGVGRDMKLEVSRDYKFNTNQVAWRLTYDFHAVHVQPSAMARLKIIADA